MASTTGKAKKKKVPRVFADSPVTVGGGGRKKKGIFVSFIDIQFSHADYIPDPEDPTSFVNPNLTLDPAALKINSAAPTNGNPPTPITVTEDSEIVIRYKRGNQPRQKIVINGGPYGISFKQGHFPYDFQNFALNLHHADNVQIKKVTIDGKEANIAPAGGTNTIEIHTK